MPEWFGAPTRVEAQFNLWSTREEEQEEKSFPSSSEMAWLTRLLAAVAFLAIGVIFSPEIFGSKSEASNSLKLSTYLKLAHLLSFSTAFGAALWVTFIGGIIMFKNLPRHQFGNLQSKMFPAYFSMVGICCAVSVASFGYLHPWKSSSTAERYQLGFLLSSFAFNLANLFVFTPMTIELMRQRHKVERENSIGEEVGWSKNVEVAKKNPKLATMNKKFGMIHGLSSLANIMSFGGLAMHSWYLAGSVQTCPFVHDSGYSTLRTKKPQQLSIRLLYLIVIYGRVSCFCYHLCTIF